MMYLLILLILLCPLNLFAGFGASGVDHPRSVSGVSLPASIGGVADDYPESLARWKFESGALTTDSRSTNTLTNVNTVTADTTNFKEGAASADLEASSSQYFTVTDANLASGFPLKNGDTGKTITISAWIRLESVIGAGAYYMLWSKYGENKASLWFGLNENERILMSLGYNSGASEETIGPHGTTLTSDGTTWYHVTGSYRDSDKAYALRVRSGTDCSVIGTDVTGTTTNNINVEDGSMGIGATLWSSWVYLYDGLIDDMAIFNTLLTADQATLVCKGLYR